MSNLRQAAQQALEAMKNIHLTLSPVSVLAISLNHRITDLRDALAKADEDRAWFEERKANWAKDKAIAQRNALEEADRVRKAEEEGRCWACGQEIKDE